MSKLDLKMDEDVEKATDSLGGGVLDTDIYKATVQTIYLGTAKEGATSATLVATLADGTEFKSTQWIKSGDSKGNKPYYERAGKKYPLPGYSVIDDICKLAAGVKLGEAEMEEKTVKIYDFELSKEVATEVDCICDVKGEVVHLAIQRQLEDKNIQNASGEYVPSGETREINEVAKVLSEDGSTCVELTDKVDAEWADKWLTKNKGKIRDKTKKVAGSTGTPKTAKKKMFG